MERTKKCRDSLKYQLENILTFVDIFKHNEIFDNEISLWAVQCTHAKANAYAQGNWILNQLKTTEPNSHVFNFVHLTFCDWHDLIKLEN